MKCCFCNKPTYLVKEEKKFTLPNNTHFIMCEFMRCPECREDFTTSQQMEKIRESLGVIPLKKERE